MSDSAKEITAHGIKIVPAPNIGSASIVQIMIDINRGYGTFSPKNDSKFKQTRSSKKHIVIKIICALIYEPRTVNMSVFILKTLSSQDFGSCCSRKDTISSLSRLIKKVARIVIQIYRITVGIDVIKLISPFINPPSFEEPEEIKLFIVSFTCFVNPDGKFPR